MEFRILGSMEVVDGDRRVELPSGRARSLLALLILHASEPVAAERLIDDLWGEHPPATAATVVQGLVSRLRKALEPQRAKGGAARLLETVGAGYRLAVEPTTIDAHRFTGLVDRVRAASAEMRVSTLSTALGLWRGAALEDFAYEPFAQRAIAALEETRIEAIELRFEAELALGRDTGLVADLQTVIATHPFRERLRGFLMIALYRAGRQSEPLMCTVPRARSFSRSWGWNRGQRCASSRERSCDKIRPSISKRRPRESAPEILPGCRTSAGA
jgi:DNA-binding SARP family transcriptional activator